MIRCFKPPGFGKIACCSLTPFVNLSQNSYGQMSNLWLVNEEGSIHCCCLAIAKSRVAPTKFVSIPRLELTAAALLVKISILLRKELTMHPHCQRVLLHWKSGGTWIHKQWWKNIFVVANKVQLIVEHSQPSRWTYNWIEEESRWTLCGLSRI